MLANELQNEYSRFYSLANCKQCWWMLMKMFNNSSLTMLFHWRHSTRFSNIVYPLDIHNVDAHCMPKYPNCLSRLFKMAASGAAPESRSGLPCRVGPNHRLSLFGCGTHFTWLFLIIGRQMFTAFASLQVARRNSPRDVCVLSSAMESVISCDFRALRFLSCVLRNPLVITQSESHQDSQGII